jgi:hypothetical protein
MKGLTMINTENLITGIAQAVALGVLTFLAGIFLADPVKSKINEWRRIIVLRRKKPIPVRVFFILCAFCSDTLRQLLLQQNRLQTIFEFELVGWEIWAGRVDSENRLKSLKTESRLEFCEKFQEEMNKYIQQTTQQNYTGINIAITGLSFPKNFYTWSTKDRKGVVIGIESLRRLFQDDPQVVNKIILRILQRMLVYSLNVKDLKAHDATRGCLFDFTRLLTDIWYSVDNTFICKECQQIILRDTNNLHTLDDIQEWIKNTSV